MNYIRIVILLLLSAFFLPSSAQRGGRAKRPAPQPVIPPSVLMEQYKFAEAAEAYDKEIAEALSTGKAVEELMAMSPEERCAFGRRAREWMLANKTWKAQGPAIREYLEKKVIAG